MNLNSNPNYFFKELESKHCLILQDEKWYFIFCMYDVHGYGAITTFEARNKRVAKSGL